MLLNAKNKINNIIPYLTDLIRFDIPATPVCVLDAVCYKEQILWLSAGQLLQFVPVILFDCTTVSK